MKKAIERNPSAKNREYLMIMKRQLNEMKDYYKVYFKNNRFHQGGKRRTKNHTQRNRRTKNLTRRNQTQQMRS